MYASKCPAQDRYNRSVGSFWRGDCGQPIGVRSGTQADLVRERLRLIREQFDACMYSALTHGGFGLKSSYLVDWEILKPIEKVATEYPNASEASIEDAYAAYRRRVRWEKSQLDR